jgi:hypothetical protein
MNSDVRSDPSWTWGGRVTLHAFLAFVFLGLTLFCTTSQDFFYLAAYIPPLLLLPFLALAILFVSLVFSFTLENGKNLHLFCSLGMSVSLFLTSLTVWKRDFEYGYIGFYDARVMLGISVCCASAVAVAWLRRRPRKTISMRQIAGFTLFISLMLAASQQILRFDKMSAYKLETIGAYLDLRFEMLASRTNSLPE